MPGGGGFFRRLYQKRNGLFFVFQSGRQIASWFPSFSVEVLHTRLSSDQPQIPESRIDAMVSTRRVHMYISAVQDQGWISTKRNRL